MVLVNAAHALYCWCLGHYIISATT